ncbi:MAG: hypothetical protein KAS32_16310 [Candidatus Peribacteraceae bacterium]|nr:hypothetical protein [Candidatus Peribacteraceae bacterium]
MKQTGTNIKEIITGHSPRNLNEEFEKIQLLEIVRADIFLTLNKDEIDKLAERVTALLEGRSKIIDLMGLLK